MMGKLIHPGFELAVGVSVFNDLLIVFLFLQLHFLQLQDQEAINH